MVSRIFLYALATIFISCSQQANEKETVYYVIKHPTESHLLDNSGVNELAPPPLPPAPPPPFYGKHNFVLLDTSTVLYYRYNGFDVYEADEAYNKPPVIGLSAKDIQTLKGTELQEFLDQNISDSPQSVRDVTVSISSPTDTIRNRGIVIIIDHLKQNGVRLYNVRNLTEEESNVLKESER